MKECKHDTTYPALAGIKCAMCHELLTPVFRQQSDNECESCKEKDSQIASLKKNVEQGWQAQIDLSKEIASLKAEVDCRILLSEHNRQTMELNAAVEGIEAEKDHYRKCHANVLKELRELKNEIMCEGQDPNGTIWDYAKGLQKEIASLKLHIIEAEMKNKELLKIEASLKELVREAITNQLVSIFAPTGMDWIKRAKKEMGE